MHAAVKLELSEIFANIYDILKLFIGLELKLFYFCSGYVMLLNFCQFNYLNGHLSW